MIEALRPGVPVIHFATGNPALLPLLGEAFGKKKRRPWWASIGGSAWTTPGGRSATTRAIQGNLDPAVLLAEPLEIRRRAKEILHQAAGRPGHIFNLGHGVLPQTPVENVLALVEAVHEFGGR